MKKKKRKTVKKLRCPLCHNKRISKHVYLIIYSPPQTQFQTKRLRVCYSCYKQTPKARRMN